MENDQENSAKQILAEKQITDIISEGLYLFYHNYGKIILPFILFLTLSNLFIVISTSQLKWYFNSLTPEFEAIIERSLESIDPLPDQDILFATQYTSIYFVILFLQFVITIFFTTLSMIIVSSYLYKKYTKTDETNEKIINKNLLFALFLIGCVAPAGIFLIVPGIIIFYFFIFILFTYNLKGVDNPITEARLIARGSFFKLIIVFMFSFIITFLVNRIYQHILNVIFPVEMYYSWLEPSNRNYLLLFLYTLISDAVGILLAPLFICLLTSLFASLKARKDLGLNDSRSSSYFTSRSHVNQEGEDYTQARIPIYRNPGVFCPFCGDNIIIIKKFCPSCGESLKDLKL